MIVNAQAGRLPLADASVDAALCSPPYWEAIRVYSGDQNRDWPAIAYPPMPGLPPVEIPAQCVALGHEPDPFAFVGHLLQVFREVRRVLRPHAVLAVNLGDSYANGAKWGGYTGGKHVSALHGNGAGGRQKRKTGIAAKNLVLMPWRFALAMQADGWVLRSRMPGGVEDQTGAGIEPDVLWWKKSCMPSSVRDRPTVDFEDVLLFSQGPRYFWDQEAGREGWADDRCGNRGSYKGTAVEAGVQRPGGFYNADGSANPWNEDGSVTGRNMRSVWTIKPEPTSESHFAAWPTELAARLIRVMTSEKGVCPECGAPWVREVERTAGWKAGIADDRPSDQQSGGRGSSALGTCAGAGGWATHGPRSSTIGWRPPCAHDADPVPAVVLDPFAGIGRTWEAARETGRRFIGTDLGFDYCRMALARNDLAAMERRRNARKPVEDFGPLFALEVVR